MAAATKTYTLEELKKHNTTEDLWIALHGRVYNITPFLEEHPGGDGVLVDNAGNPPTKSFCQFPSRRDGNANSREMETDMVSNVHARH
jgi:cytochrome b involved in lipid metabolism